MTNIQGWILLILLILPFILTIQNITSIFYKKTEISKKQKNRILINDMLIMILGLNLMIALYGFVNTHKDYDYQFKVYQYEEGKAEEPPLHSMIATWTVQSVMWKSKQ